METIKIYLENMFMNLPENGQVIKAKQELLAIKETVEQAEECPAVIINAAQNKEG